jgi:hypothetical protein
MNRKGLEQPRPFFTPSIHPRSTLKRNSAKFTACKACLLRLMHEPMLSSPLDSYAT